MTTTAPASGTLTTCSSSSPAGLLAALELGHEHRAVHRAAAAAAAAAVVAVVAVLPAAAGAPSGCPAPPLRGHDP